MRQSIVDAKRDGDGEVTCVTINYRPHIHQSTSMLARSRLYVVISSLPRGVNCHRTRKVFNSNCKSPSNRITTLSRHSPWRRWNLSAERS